MSNSLNDVVAMSTLADLFCQCAEECSELAQAALKARRCIEGTTPVGYAAAREHLEEETADVLNTIAALRRARVIRDDRVEEIQTRKMDRWAERLWRGEDAQDMTDKEEAEPC